MKNIPIKFRAKCIETGNLITFELGECSAELRPDYLSVISDDVYTIDAETICQLVGYDAAGNEVYEGDWIKLEGNTTDVVQVRWDNNHTCVAVTWKNGLSDSYGTVFNHYDRKPFLVEVDDNE